MTLNDLFSWMHSHEYHFERLSDSMVGQVELEKELDDATRKHQALLAEVRVLNFSTDKTDFSLKEKALAELYVQSQLIQFLEFCQGCFKKKDKNLCYDLALKYLNTLSEGKNLFHERFILSALLKISRTFEHLKQALIYQENPLGMVKLFEACLCEPEEMAASVLWMLHKGATPQKIIATGFLHRFLAYNLFLLGQEKNPINTFYQVLACDSLGKDLVQEAEKVSCELRGFEKYSLAGSFADNHKISSIEETPCQFSEYNENFGALFELFGVEFVKLALVQVHHSQNKAWKALIAQSLNQAIDTKQLASLINIYAKQYPPEILKQAAALISDEKIKQLLDVKEGAVLHLLRYKPQSENLFINQDIAVLIKGFLSEDYDVYEVVPQLLALLNIFKKKNTQISNQIYKEIISIVLVHSYCLDDGAFLTCLRRYQNKNEMISQVVTDIENQFESVLQHLSKNASTESSFYYILEDAWYLASRQLNTIELISSVKTTIPADKYHFIACLGRAFFKIKSNPKALEEFIAWVQFKPLLLEKGISEYERLLIVLLANIDKADLRLSIMHELEKKYSSYEYLTKHYPQHNVYHQAVFFGNTGLIQHLVDCKQFAQLDKARKQNLLNLAVQKESWGVVRIFFEQKLVAISDKYKEKILIKASESGQLEIVNLFLREGDGTNQFDKKLQKCVIEAIKADHLEFAQSLAEIKYIKKLHNELKKFFLSAVSKGELSRVMFYCKLKKNSLNSYDLGEGLKDAARKGHYELVGYLLNLEHNSARFSAIEDALVKASKKGHVKVVKALCEGPRVSPRGCKIEGALIIAACKGHHKIINYILDHYAEMLTEKGIDNALKGAAVSGHLDAVKAICQSHVISLSKKAIKHGKSKASSKNHLETYEYLKSYETEKRLAVKVFGRARSLSLFASSPSAPDSPSSVCSEQLSCSYN